MRIYDLIIIGAGPAGITAGIYAKNFGLDCLIIGEENGGLVNSAYKVENYPGIFNISGKELTEKFKAHQKHLKIPFKKERAEKIIPRQARDKTTFEIFTDKNNYYSKTVVLAFGTEVKKLDIKNVEKLEGKGVSYKLNDSVYFYKNKTIAVIGGANAAVMSASAIAEKAKRVYLIYRKEKLRADALWINKIKHLKNVEIIYEASIVELKGKNKLEEIVLNNGKRLKINGLLAEIGCVPNAFLIRDLGIATDEMGYIKTRENQATNVPGIFAAGDVTIGSNGFRQIITAAAEGAVAVLGAFNYLNKK